LEARDDEELVMTIGRAGTLGLGLAIVAAATMAPAAAQDFYKGKTLTIVVGFTPGGGFDLYARVLARHMGRHIPGNPDVIVQNMPGAASLKSVLYLDTAAPRNGTVMATFNFGQIGDSRMMPEKVKVDFREFSWIGSISQDLTICYTWHALGIKTLARLWPELQRHGTIHMGLTGIGSSSDINQKILKEIFKIPLQQVAGCPGSAEERLAVERGELDGDCGDCGAWSSIPQERIEGAKINPIVRSARVEPPDLPPHVPYVLYRAERSGPRHHWVVDRVGPARAFVHRFVTGACGPHRAPPRGLRRNHEGPAIRRGCAQAAHTGLAEIR
jgi:tripartite-type tricarboxylate transporter receptor subunit TctC